MQANIVRQAYIQAVIQARRPRSCRQLYVQQTAMQASIDSRCIFVYRQTGRQTDMYTDRYTGRRAGIQAEGEQ